MSNSNDEQRENSMSEQQIEQPESVPMRQRAIRCDDETWDEARLITALRDETISEVVRVALRRYNKRHRHLLDKS